MATLYPVVVCLLTCEKWVDIAALQSRDWDGDVDLGSVEEEEEDGESMADRLRQVIGSPLWVSVRDFLTSQDLLHMRTTGIKWNFARLYGHFAELLLFFLKKEKDKRKTRPSSRMAKFAI